MVHNGCKCYFSFWVIDCPFTSLTAQKIKILKKWIKHMEISSLNNSVPKIMIICYTVPEVWHVTDVIIFCFGSFFLPFYPPNSPKKSKFYKNEKKKKKTPGDIIILHMCTRNYDQMMHSSWDMHDRYCLH